MIAEAEDELGKLPDDYRSFLLDFGTVSHAGDEVCGLGESLPKYLNVVHMTHSEQAAGLPPGFIAVMNDGGGNITALAEGSVVVWDHQVSPSEGPFRVSGSFSEWLLDLIG